MIRDTEKAETSSECHFAPPRRPEWCASIATRGHNLLHSSSGSSTPCFSRTSFPERKLEEGGWWDEPQSHVHSISSQTPSLLPPQSFLHDPHTQVSRTRSSSWQTFISERSKPLVIITLSDQGCCVCLFTDATRRANSGRYPRGSPRFQICLSPSCCEIQSCLLLKIRIDKVVIGQLLFLPLGA